MAAIPFPHHEFRLNELQELYYDKCFSIKALQWKTADEIAQSTLSFNLPLQLGRSIICEPSTSSKRYLANHKSKKQKQYIL